ncbi:MAG: fumarylacetoacetate hydrolase family protein [Myxococcales bacterium]|nr:fumarylacetoacetate hydrolase family protein [Myxococcales bacterium]
MGNRSRIGPVVFVLAFLVGACADPPSSAQSGSKNAGDATADSAAAAPDTTSPAADAQVAADVPGATDTKSAAVPDAQATGDSANAPDIAVLPTTGIKKWVRFSHNGKVQFGRLVGSTVHVLNKNFLAGGTPTGKTVALSNVTVLAPVVPGKVLAIGLNYTDHAGSSSTAPPPAFFKQPGCIVGPDAPILRPKGASNLHFEGEIVLVIGKEAADVSEAKALDYLFGVTAGNDVSERSWQSSDLQWFRAKGSDTFGPIGPTIVSGADVQSLKIATAVNGKVVQDSSAKLMIHSIKKIISFVSGVMKLQPGDVIFTGTPGKTFALSNGDKVTVTVEHVGSLSNVVKAK